MLNSKISFYTYSLSGEEIKSLIKIDDEIVTLTGMKGKVTKLEENSLIYDNKSAVLHYTGVTQITRKVTGDFRDSFDLFKIILLSVDKEKWCNLFDALYSTIPNEHKWDKVNNGASFYMDICRAYNAGRRDQNEIFHGNSPQISSDEYYRSEFLKETGN